MAPTDVCGSEERPAGGVQGVIRRSRTARADRVFCLDMSIFDIRNVTGRVKAKLVSPTPGCGGGVWIP